MCRCFAQIIEKRIIKKLVPKMVEVEEEYEYEVGLTGARAGDKAYRRYRRCSCSDARLAARPVCGCPARSMMRHVALPCVLFAAFSSFLGAFR